MSQGSVYNIFKDRTGYLWFSTQEGLNRYDGSKIKTYRYDPSNTSTIQGTTIWGIIEEKNSNLWIGSDRGLIHYNRKKDCFSSIAFHIGNTKTQTDISPFALIGDDSLFLQVFPKGIYLYKISENRWLQIDSNVSFLYDYNRTNCSITKNSNFWLLDDSGIVEIQSNNNRTIVYSKEMLTHSKNYKEIFTSFDLEGDSILWISSLSDIIRFDIKNKTNTTYPFTSKYGLCKLYRLCFLEANVLLLGSDKGIFRIQVSGKKINIEEHLTKENSPLSGNYISNIYKDREKHIWINADPNGISHYQYATTIVKKNYTINGKTVPINDLILSFAEGVKNRKYIGFSNGLVVVDSAFHLLQSHPMFKGVAILCLKTIQNELLVGTDDGLYILEANSNKIIAGKLLQGSPIQCIFQTSALGLILRTNTALYQFDSKKHEVYLLNNVDPSLTMMKDLDSIKIIGANYKGGVSVFLTKNKKIVDTKKISSKIIINDFIVNGRNLICATETGLMRFSLKDGSYSSINDINIEKVKMYNIIESDKGQFWMNSNNGIYHYSEHNKSRKITTANGLSSIEYNGNAFYLTKNKELLCAGNNGIDRFNITEILKERISPMPYFFSIYINDELKKKEDFLNYPEAIKLNFDQNTISFEPGIIDFNSNGHNSIAYLLQGFDKNWVINKSNTLIRYANLPPGKYTMMIKAANADNVWSVTPASIAIIVSPPYYQTWWFYLLCCLFVCSVFYGIYRYRLSQQLKAFRMRQNIANDLHDDIGSTLASISFTSQYLKKELHAKDKHLSEVVGGMYENSRTAMENLSDIVWSINPMNDKFLFIINKFRSIGNTIEQTTDIVFVFHVDEACNQLELNMQARKNIYLIVKEIINNTLKHAHAEHIDVRFQLQHQLLIITIADDGIGFEPTSSFVGNGLKSIQARVEELNGKLTLNARPNIGVAYNIAFPLSHLVV